MPEIVAVSSSTTRFSSKNIIYGIAPRASDHHLSTKQDVEARKTMRRRTLQALFAFVASSSAHSWVEQLTVIAPNGTFVGTPGYARGNYLRSTSGFSDTTMTYLLPPSSRANVTLILPTDKLCKSTQQTPNQTDGSPRLQASAGAAVALRYQENGHVTLPWNQPGKPKNRGTIYVYGTTQPKTGEKLLDVHGVWNSNGTGGDGRGVLLSQQNFDDGRCYQINSGNISESRQEEYPHQANQLMGADMWCQQDIRLPSTAPSGKLYTLYWVWDWPTAPGVDPTYPQGKQEIYTTCMDVDVVGTSVSQKEIEDEDGYAVGQDLNSAAIPSEFADLDDAPAAAETTALPSPLSHPKSTSTLTITSTVEVQVVTVTAWKTTEKTVTVGGCRSTGTMSAGRQKRAYRGG
ncbi:uncharacterized protein N7482_000729 [Penicillium canariense]|uniref:DUF7492 domain-containing protein n=1 Tax=Penicillium canariense TaxID=189055 RepID=A0A9W9IEH0_9EURO|nr:uncharacterized protein N7482_000729 [Penicillium canariense]KAJ5174852.1 hypothetical protein N7482_000729 [Penicillium canariense]